MPKERIFVVNGDTLLSNPYKEIKKVEKYLGLSQFFSPDHFYFHYKKGRKLPCFKLPEPHCMRKDKGRYHPPLKMNTKEELKKIFQPMVQEFENLTGVYLDVS